MEPTPAPTPYDITQIPYFPYVPGWAAFLFVFLITGAFLYFMSKRKRQRNQLSFNHYSLALDDLKRLRSQYVKENLALDKFAATRASAIVRHYLAFALKAPVDRMTPKELAQLRVETTSKSAALLLTHVLKLEDLKYQSESSERPSPDILSDIEVGVMALHQEKASEEAKLKEQREAAA
jgi:hypothetical protein